MAANVGSLFNAGPHVVKSATFEDGLTMAELGGPDSKCRAFMFFGQISDLAKAVCTTLIIACNHCKIMELTSITSALSKWYDRQYGSR